MIQSGKFDSSYMNIKKISNTALQFLIKRFIEIIGICVSLLGIFILIALISYSPEDPNFIFPEKTIIKNFLGYQGSFISDLILQSIGLISYLIPITFIFSGISIFNKKKIYLIIENSFFITIYCSFGSLFFSTFHTETFELYINGTGGFLGNYLSETFLKNITSPYTEFFYYFLILITVVFFLISINFKIKNFISTFKRTTKFILKTNQKNYKNKK